MIIPDIHLIFDLIFDLIFNYIFTEPLPPRVRTSRLRRGEAPPRNRARGALQGPRGEVRDGPPRWHRRLRQRPLRSGAETS